MQDTETIYTPELGRAILDRYWLTLRGIHGLAHWARVYQNAILLRGDKDVDDTYLELFALLHDIGREHDGIDQSHGLKAASWMQLNLDGIVEGQHADTVSVAVYYHTLARPGEKLDIDKPVRDVAEICWDADRLDIGRTGVRPHEKYFHTKSGISVLSKGEFDEFKDVMIVPDWVEYKWPELYKAWEKECSLVYYFQNLK